MTKPSRRKVKKVSGGILGTHLRDRVKRKSGHPSNRAAEAFRAQTTELIALRKALKNEIARKETCATQLTDGARHYSQLLAHSVRMQEQARRVAHQVLIAQEEERKQISRELHDEIAQILAGINVQLAALSEASAIDGRALKEKISKTQLLVEESVEVVHRYARELRPALLDDLGLIPALRAFIRDLPAHKGLRIQLTAFAGVEALENLRRTVLYRVAQEALTNVARHARAQLVTVRVHKIGNKVRLVIQDDGKSFNVDRILNSNTNKRLGLIGMRERVEMVSGTLTIESAPGNGTTVRAVIPFRRENQGDHK